ncbi:MAG: Gfo/Idh/MocA family oxidoreductase [bacterium]|jgi:predicted dehydrogenase|nr:Gfo/Idh/MocA family oxidoreductase [bacterium]
MKRRARMGMVGGGRGAFIGAVHRMAARLDDKIDLVCGAFSSNPEKSLETGGDLFLSKERIYGSYEEMFRQEASLPAEERMDFVSIVAPNFMHYPVAAAALDAGFHVVCDKPMTMTLEEAKKLQQRVRETGLLFCLTHNYTGYPMVKEARHLVSSGQIGKIRRVVVEYPQGWMALPLEAGGQKQAAWRTDPARAGVSFTMGDIGSHCANLAEYITGLEIEEVCADLTSFVSGRALDDDGSVLLRFNEGARGVLWASGIAVGEENGLNIRIYGEKGAIEWHQMEPNTLIVRWLDKPFQTFRTATDFVGEVSIANTRIPSGHPEGFIEAFANIYRNFAEALDRRLEGDQAATGDFPGVDEGVRGMAFIEAVVKSSQADSRWMHIG